MSNYSSIFAQFFRTEKRRNIAVDVCFFLAKPTNKGKFLMFKNELAKKYSCTLANVNQVVAILKKAGLINTAKNRIELNVKYSQDLTNKYSDFIMQVLRGKEP
jgi:hypothetical protein